MNATVRPLDLPDRPILVLGATGKTGRRVASRLQALDQTVRLGSRTESPPFDWTQEAGWDRCLDGVDSIYINYPSDLPVLGFTEILSAFVDKAVRHGARRLVLLTGRGETEAQKWERVVQESGLEWTVIRAAWFQQNFSEGAFLEMVQSGQIVLPAGDIPEPFIDLDDIADVAVAALTQPGHSGEIYEVTGPRLLTFSETANELSQAIGRPIDYQQVPLQDFVDAVDASGAPEAVVWMMDHLFATVLDGRNAHLTDGVQRALNRQPKDFSDFAREVAGTDIWRKIA